MKRALAVIGLGVAVVCPSGCAGGSFSSPAPPPARSTTSSASPGPVPAVPSEEGERLRDAPRIRWWRGPGVGVSVDGVRALVPDGFREGHLRTGYAFLGYHDTGRVAWLSMVAPVQAALAAPTDVAAQRPVRHDLHRWLRDSDSVEVLTLGRVVVAGRRAPVVHVVGDVTLCAGTVGPATCRWNTPERFYLLVPYARGTLVVEGESDVVTTGGREDRAALVSELQDWAGSIRLDQEPDHS